MPNVSLKPLATDQPPAKYKIEVTPELDQELKLYAAAYEAEYGNAPKVSELIPVMVEQFLEKDRAFKRFKKEAAKHNRQSNGGDSVAGGGVSASDASQERSASE